MDLLGTKSHVVVEHESRFALLVYLTFIFYLGNIFNSYTFAEQMQ